MDERLRILDTDTLSLVQRAHPVVASRLKALLPKQRSITIKKRHFSDLQPPGFCQGSQLGD